MIVEAKNVFVHIHGNNKNFSQSLAKLHNQWFSWPHAIIAQAAYFLPDSKGANCTMVSSIGFAIKSVPGTLSPGSKSRRRMQTLRGDFPERIYTIIESLSRVNVLSVE